MRVINLKIDFSFCHHSLFVCSLRKLRSFPVGTTAGMMDLNDISTFAFAESRAPKSHTCENSTHPTTSLLTCVITNTLIFRDFSQSWQCVTKFSANYYSTPDKAAREMALCVAGSEAKIISLFYLVRKSC